MKKCLLAVAVISLSTTALVRAQQGYDDGSGLVTMPPPPPQMQSAPADSDAAYFYNSLQPHGTWLQVSPFGPVWRPAVAVKDSSWRPYSTCGRWVWAKNAWTWESEYEWGWAPFHYGRWIMSRGLGWVWVPGREWSPAWVAWQQTSTQHGWAPLPPSKSTYFGAGVTASTDCGGAWGFQFDLSQNHYVYASPGCFTEVVTVPAAPDNVVVVIPERTYYSAYSYRDCSDDRNYWRYSYRDRDSDRRSDRDHHDSGSYRSNDSDRHHEERPTVNVVRETNVVKAPETSRRTTIMQQVVSRQPATSSRQVAPTSSTPPVTTRSQTPAPQVSNSGNGSGNNNGNNSSDRRSSRLQDIITRSRK